MNEKIKRIIYIVVLVLIILTFVSLLFFTKDSEKIKEIQDFVKTDTKVLYVSLKNNNNYIEKLLDKYDVNLLSVNSSTLSIFEIKKLKDITNTKSLNNVVIVYQNGKIVGTLNNYHKEEELNNFLQKYNIIPSKIVDNVKNIMEDSLNLLDNEYLMAYIIYEEHSDIEEQNEMFESISLKYSIPYKKIDATLLSKNQHEKINSLLGISSVEDQILILIKDKKVVSNLRGIHSKNTYKETLNDAGFIDESLNGVEYIDYDAFEEILDLNEKNIILIGNDKTKNSIYLLNLLNKITHNYNIAAKYINIKKEDLELYNNIKNKIADIGYEGAYSLPIMLIVESNKILDFVIGNTTEEYLIDLFLETGVIKGDVTNE